jgi:hypothetical protein
MLFKKIQNLAACEMRSVIRFWEQFHHPHYSPDLAPTDFHLFLHPKCFFVVRLFHDVEVKEAATTCFATHVEGIQTLVQRYEKCLKNGGN